MKHKRAFPAVLVATVLYLAASPSAAANIPSQRGPGVYWFMQEARLEAPESAQPDNMYWLDNRPYNVDVSVGVSFYFKNDDGSHGGYIGSTNEGTSTQTIRYGQTPDHANDIGDRLGYAAAGLAGQEIGYHVSQRAADAARAAAAQASPLSPGYQYGNWFADAATTGRNFAGRLIGALGGVF
jgi:hypothetical protein